MKSKGGKQKDKEKGKQKDKQKGKRKDEQKDEQKDKQQNKQRDKLPSSLFPKRFFNTSRLLLKSVQIVSKLLP